MPSPFLSFFSRKKPTATTLPFKDYYEEWFNTLKNTLLPLLRHSLSSSSPALLPFRRDLLLQHFLSYYDSLDLAASNDVSQLLYPSSWRNPLELPFLFLGDLHPYLFTNLLRSFIDTANKEEEEEYKQEEEDDDDDEEEEEEEERSLEKAPVVETLETLHKPWRVLTAWINPSKSLMLRIEQIECGLRLMVPPLVSRLKKAQAGFVRRAAENYCCELQGNNKKAVMEEAMKVEMEEMVGIFVDANRLRRSTIAEIVNATDVYQGSLFLEGLAQFLVGFKDSALTAHLHRCKLPNNIEGVYWHS